MSMHDGVSKLWIVRADRGLDVDGFDNEISAIDRLVRRALMAAPIGTVDDVKARINATVAEALTHLDPKPRPCNRHDDCDAADAKARKSGLLGAEHCHDDCCEDCFGQ